MLKLRNIQKNYYVGDNVIKALVGVSLEFRKNEFVSILGPSGCGKTTLLNIIGGLDKYTNGDLFINNQSTKHFSDHDWDTYRNHRIGFVFQNYNLIHHQNVLANVELALTLSGISKSERKRRAIEALESVGLHDQIYKKPNQLSGGQMQRVAIARALVNNPDIILADEPTGALDSETSVQIMEILKEISQDRLIIMVTHNPDISNRFSTRIIRLLDGEVTGDSDPYETEEVVAPKIMKKDRKVQKNSVKRTSMSFLTALNLSLQNLFTKKGRTLLTAFAGSIGIIGIAIVLALSNGFQTYINKMQTDTLSAYPLTISESATNFASLMSVRYNNDEEKFPNEEKVYINKIMELMQNSRFENDITDDYIDNVIKKIDTNLYTSIKYKYGIEINVFRDTNRQAFRYQKVSSSLFSEMAVTDNEDDPYDFFKSQYDLIGANSKFPENMNEIVLVVNQYNQVSDASLLAMGIDYRIEEENEIDFSRILGHKYKVILNDNIYEYDEEKGHFLNNITTTSIPLNNIMRMDVELINEDIFNRTDNFVELEIVGIVRPNESTEVGSVDMNAVLAYSPELTKHILNESLKSNIVKWMNQEENATKNPLTNIDYVLEVAGGQEITEENKKDAEELRQKDFSKYGGEKKPVQISIFAKDFDSKQKIKDYLDLYNMEKKEEAIRNYYSDVLGIPESEATDIERKEAEAIGESAQVLYEDLMDVLVSSLNTLVDVISIVLIVFTSISLVVSSIMIGIITYISVLERTKEIGVLRSIGARKKDISRVFNAETVIIGFTAGLLGIIIALILAVPANIILYNLVEINSLVLLNPIHAVFLIVISMVLTLIAGLIPSRVAAKKDPVIALRTE